MCVECVSGQRSIITPIPIAMSPTVQALTAERDDLLEALRELVRLKAVKDDMEARIAASGPPVNWPVCVHTAMADYKSNNTTAWDAARLAIAKATTITEKP